jgi:hypothetical protein
MPERGWIDISLPPAERRPFSDHLKQDHTIKIPVIISMFDMAGGPVSGK